MRVKQPKRVWVLVDNGEAIDRATMTDGQAQAANDDLESFNRKRRWQLKKSFHGPKRHRFSRMEITVWPMQVESGAARHIYSGHAEADDSIYKM